MCTVFNTAVMSEQSLVHGKMRTGILFLMNLICAFGRLRVGPQNAAVIAGERMTMECRVDEESRVRKWDLFDVNRVTTTVYWLSNEGGIIHQNFAHFGVQANANGSGILFANSTKMEDAGNYTCIAKIDNKDAKFSAQLIVFESLPVCESNLTPNYSYSSNDGDKIWFHCIINFRGFWAPSLEWIQHVPKFRPEGKSVTDGIETVHSPSQSVTSRLTIAVNSSTNGSYYSCKIYFSKYSNSAVTTANNIPNFTYTWNSSVIYVSRSSATDAGTSSAVTSSSSTTEKSSSVECWSTALYSGIVVLSICVGIGTISVCIVNRRNKFKSGPTEKAEETTAHSNPHGYPNVITKKNPTIKGSQTAAYMELTSTTQASL